MAEYTVDLRSGTELPKILDKKPQAPSLGALGADLWWVVMFWGGFNTIWPRNLAVLIVTSVAALIAAAVVVVLWKQRLRQARNVVPLHSTYYEAYRDTLAHAQRIASALDVLGRSGMLDADHRRAQVVDSMVSMARLAARREEVSLAFSALQDAYSAAQPTGALDAQVRDESVRLTLLTTKLRESWGRRCTQMARLAETTTALREKVAARDKLIEVLGRSAGAGDTSEDTTEFLADEIDSLSQALAELEA